MTVHVRDMVLTERQVAFLRVLANPEHFKGMRPSAGLGAGRVYWLAFPNAPYKGRRDAGATATLDALERKGLARGSYPPWAELGSRSWRITDKGSKVLAEIGG